MTIQKIRREAKKFGEPGSEEYDIAVVLMSALVVGANQERIREFTGVDRWQLQTWAHRLRRNGVFVGGKVAASEWFDEEVGGLAFSLDIATAQGFLAKASA